MGIRVSGAVLALAGVAVTSFMASSAAGQMTPVGVSGFNADLVVESTAQAPYFPYAQIFDGAGNAWYEQGLPGSTKGLPAGGAFASVSDPTIHGQLQPYDGPNALLLDASVPASLLFFDPEAQIAYDSIAIFASSANGGGVGIMEVNFTDGSVSSDISFNAQDWFNNTGNNALNNLGRVDLNTDAVDDASAGNPRIYQTVIDLAALGLNNRSISSLTFIKPSGSLATAVFGVSGRRAVTGATPIDAAGWNRDIVVENTATPPYAGFASAFDTFNNLSWYEVGLPGSMKGLPLGGSFVSLSNPAIQGQFQPYSGPNALFLDVAGPTGTLTLAPAGQRPYEFLVVFACSSNQGGVGTCVVTFSDSTTTGEIPFNAQDWFNVATNNALNNLGRLSLNNDTPDDGSAGNPRVYQTVIDLASMGFSDRAVASITFTKPNVGGAAQNTVIMGISGQPVPGVTGSCSFPDGTCGLLPPANCKAAGGTYGGDNTSCPSTGACIAVDGSCSIRNESNCAFVGGMYLGDGSTCPALGACIATNGDCMQLNSFQCAIQGGTFLGEGQGCPLTGACCLASGCAIMNSFQCAFAGGAYQGDGTTCQLSYPSIAPGGSAFEDISSSGTQITTWTGGVDDGNANIPIGFTFPFFGNTYTDAYVCTNGFISFGAGNSAFANTCLPNTAAPNNDICPLWDDYHLHPSSSGRVLYETRTSPNRLIVQWDLVGHYNAGNPPVDQSTFEAVLFDNGNIEFRYGSISPVGACGAGGAGATVGIEDSTGTIGLNYDNTQLGGGGASLAMQAVSPCPTCRADFNGDGHANSQDFFDFLAAFFTLQGNADFNHDGVINSQDFFDFLTAFFMGC